MKFKIYFTALFVFTLNTFFGLRSMYNIDLKSQKEFNIKEFEANLKEENFKYGKFCSKVEKDRLNEIVEKIKNKYSESYIQQKLKENNASTIGKFILDQCYNLHKLDKDLFFVTVQSILEIFDVEGIKQFYLTDKLFFYCKEYCICSELMAYRSSYNYVIENNCQQNDGDFLTKLITAGADLDTIFIRDIALNIAVEQGSFEAVKILLQYGADINKQIYGKTPFYEALIAADNFSYQFKNNSKYKIINEFLDYGVDVNFASTATIGRNSLILFILSYPLDANCHAIKRIDEDMQAILYKLLKAGADPFKKDLLGKCFMDYIENWSDFNEFLKNYRPARIKLATNLPIDVINIVEKYL